MTAFIAFSILAVGALACKKAPAEDGRAPAVSSNRAADVLPGATASNSSGGTAARLTTADYEPPPADQCEFSDTPASGKKRCLGYLPADWSGWGSQSADMVKWIRKSVRYAKESPSAPRETEVSGDPVPGFTIAMVEDAGSVALSRLTDRGLVVAKIMADPDPNVGKDRRYGIARRGRPFDRDYYVVIMPFNPNGKDWPPQPAQPIQREVSTWRVYGVNSHTGKLTPTGNSGRFSRCEHVHTKQERLSGARFNTCNEMSSYAAWTNDSSLGPALDRQFSLQQQRPSGPRSRIDALIEWIGPAAADSASLRSRLAELLGPGTTLPAGMVESLAGHMMPFFREQATDPGWMTCGLGCCVADDQS